MTTSRGSPVHRFSHETNSTHLPSARFVTTHHIPRKLKRPRLILADPSTTVRARELTTED